ncbi:MAG: helix-turn-helix domain-containing protein [Rhodospirillales bacterium]
MNEDFPANLRLLTDRYKSIAEVCRKLDINRTQFNKYLNGTSSPSRHILHRVCEFFGVGTHEILLPNAAFAEIVRLRSGARPGPDTYTGYLDLLARRSRRDISVYDGYYFEYSYSMARPGLILRSLMRLKTDAGISTYRRIENMAMLDGPGPRVPGKYRGIAFYLDDRIFQVDFDTLTGNEISQTILYPNYENRHNRLPGLKLGVSSSSVRQPLCARVVHVALGTTVNVRKALGECGLIRPESDLIDPKIRAMIENAIEPGAFHFSVVTGG